MLLVVIPHAGGTNLLLASLDSLDALSLASKSCIDVVVVSSESSSVVASLSYRGYSLRIAVQQETPPGSIYSAMNEGALGALNEYVYFLNCGDCVTQLFEGLLCLLQRFKPGRLAVIAFPVWALASQGRHHLAIPPRHRSAGLISNCWAHQGLVYTRSAFAICPFDLKLKCASDYKQLMSLLFIVNSIYVPLPYLGACVLMAPAGFSRTNANLCLVELKSVRDHFRLSFSKESVYGFFWFFLFKVESYAAQHAHFLIK